MAGRLLSSNAKQHGKAMLERLDQVLLGAGTILNMNIKAVTSHHIVLMAGKDIAEAQQLQQGIATYFMSDAFLQCRFSAEHNMAHMDMQPLCCPGLTHDWTAGWSGTG